MSSTRTKYSEYSFVESRAILSILWYVLPFLSPNHCSTSNERCNFFLAFVHDIVVVVVKIFWMHLNLMQLLRRSACMPQNGIQCFVFSGSNTTTTTSSSSSSRSSQGSPIVVVGINNNVVQELSTLTCSLAGLEQSHHLLGILFSGWMTFRLYVGGD